jgi:hypothetical protein
MDNIARNEVIKQINSFLKNRGNNIKTGFSSIIRKVNLKKKLGRKSLRKIKFKNKNNGKQK